MYIPRVYADNQFAEHYEEMERRRWQKRDTERTQAELFNRTMQGYVERGEVCISFTSTCTQANVR